MKKVYQNQDGFLALMSAIIIVLVLLMITSTLSLTGFFNRFNILDSESKERSFAAAEACGDVALLRLFSNPSYLGNNEVVDVGSDQCMVVSVTTSGSEKTIMTKADINGSVTNIKIVVNSSDLSMISWEEI